jgi:hypothetical protein
MSRIYYDRNGRTRGYSTGPGGWMVKNWLELALMLLMLPFTLTYCSGARRLATQRSYF